MSGDNAELRGPPSRRSIFLEAPMDEYSPANSIHEAAFRERRRNGCLVFWTDGKGKLVLRVVNAALHLGLCCVLLAIVIEFMVRYKGHKRRSQAIVLMTIVAIDCCLDIWAVIRLRKDWQGWAIVVRLLFGLGYIAQFLLYVGVRRMFPPRYSYWGMNAVYSEPVVYFLLLALAIWNMLHAVFRRHTLGRDVRRYASSIQAWRHRRSRAGRHGNGPSSRRVSARGTPEMAVNAADTGHESDASASASIVLGIVQHTDRKGPTVVVTSHSGMSRRSGESSSQRGSAVHADSPEGTPWTSRTPSDSVMDDRDSTLGSEADGSLSVDTKL